MVYLLLGENTQAKDAKIQEIKAAVLGQQAQAVHFDFESLDALHLSASNLKKSLLGIAMFSSKRLILIRHAHKLKTETAELLAASLSEPLLDCDLVLEAPEQLKSPLKEAASRMTVISFGFKPEASIFDMTKLISSRKTAEALKMLHGFYDQGMHPLQMMGALLWYWGKQGRPLGPVRYERGLKALEEADLNIKRSRLLPEYALEKLVIELVELQK